MKNNTDNEKLGQWQERLARSESAYEAELAKMNRREELYAGRDVLRPMVEFERRRYTPHVRNICAEMIEAQVSSTIPQPKVTALRAEDEGKAKLIEDMLRNELDRLPFETLNDMLERTVPIQGGAGLLLEWDSGDISRGAGGELSVSALHPKQIIPQDGVFTGIEDMDYIILKLPQTKGYIRRRYGVDVDDETEEDPEVRGAGAVSTADELVTQYVAYYRGEGGRIGLYSWTGDTQLEALDDYQARRGGDGPLEKEALYEPVRRSDGTQIGGVTPVITSGEPDGDGNIPVSYELVPELIPLYRPDRYPVILQKNVSVYGRFLGDSDVDKIADQQNTANRIEAKIIDKLIKSGSCITLPDDAKIEVDTTDMRIIRPGNAADKALIDVYDLEGRIEQDMAYLAQVYEEARQITGITDSFQGRADRTATSGKAKEFAAAQSAGRLESKRVMKNAAYAALFELMFKYKLAYADEPRPVISHDIHGNTQYGQFNRYDFLERDAAGEWYWNDRFLFSCDTTAPLASNREAMWQETRLNLESGAFGDRAALTTLILFWSKMEMLHYPGAGETKTYLEEELQRQQQAQAMQQQIQQMQQQIQQAQAPAADPEAEQRLLADIDARARADAAAALGIRQ